MRCSLSLSRSLSRSPSQLLSLSCPHCNILFLSHLYFWNTHTQHTHIFAKSLSRSRILDCLTYVILCFILVCMCVSLYICQSHAVFFCLSVCLSVCLFVGLFVCLPTCLSVSLTLFLVAVNYLLSSVYFLTLISCHSVLCFEFNL